MLAQKTIPQAVAKSAQERLRERISSGFGRSTYTPSTPPYRSQSEDRPRATPEASAAPAIKTGDTNRPLKDFDFTGVPFSIEELSSHGHFLYEELFADDYEADLAIEDLTESASNGFAILNASPMEKPSIDEDEIKKRMRFAKIEKIEHALLCVPSGYLSGQTACVDVSKVPDGEKRNFLLFGRGNMTAYDDAGNRLSHHPYGSWEDAPWQRYWSRVRRVSVSLSTKRAMKSFAPRSARHRRSTWQKKNPGSSTANLQPIAKGISSSKNASRLRHGACVPHLRWRSRWRARASACSAGKTNAWGA